MGRVERSFLNHCCIKGDPRCLESDDVGRSKLVRLTAEFVYLHALRHRGSFASPCGVFQRASLVQGNVKQLILISSQFIIIVSVVEYKAIYLQPIAKTRPQTFFAALFCVRLERDQRTYASSMNCPYSQLYIIHKMNWIAKDCRFQGVLWSAALVSW